MLLILEVDEAMQQWGLVADIEVTEFGLVAWQKISLLIKGEDGHARSKQSYLFNCFCRPTGCNDESLDLSETRRTSGTSLHGRDVQ